MCEQYLQGILECKLMSLNLIGCHPIYPHSFNFDLLKSSYQVNSLLFLFIDFDLSSKPMIN